MFGSNDWPLIPAHVNVQRPNPMAPRSSEEGPTKFVALRVPILPVWAPPSATAVATTLNRAAIVTRGGMVWADYVSEYYWIVWTANRKFVRGKNISIKIICFHASCHPSTV